MNGYYIYQGWRLRQKIGDRRSEKKRVNSDPERTLAAAEILHFPKIGTVLFEEKNNYFHQNYSVEKHQLTFCNV